jgi:hypothetical protein
MQPSRRRETGERTLARSDGPPEIGYFGRRRAEPGPHTAALRLDPLQVEIAGLGREQADLLLERYRPYSADRANGSGALRVRVGLDDRDYFIDPPAGVELVQVRIACDTDRVRYASYQAAGWFEFLGGRGELLLARGRWEPLYRSFENYVRAAVAWQAASRGGALVHAASAVWNGRAYLFYGESGAGKSTLSACNRRARVVSDDLSLVLPGDGGGLEVVGSPFRGTYEGGAPVQGRFPLAAGFRLVKAPAAAVRPVNRLRAMAELVGNLPFVAEEFAKRPDLFERTERAFAGVPLAHLHFAKDDTYWDAIAAAGY